ncbi:MAG TPA: hypothetical protein VKY19_13400 [Ktedonosporobacter sp.]|jgi:hypothetical protein|nr:hypothetical protein [Ktedonosporobacter sp.]
MLYTPLVCTFYFPPEPLTQEWLWKVLHTLWQHGLHFSPQTTQEATWSAELEGSDRRQIWHGSEATSSSDQDCSLEEFIRRATRDGVGATRLWDREVAMLLRLDPAGTVSDDLPAPQQAIGRVHLWMDGGYRSLGFKQVLPPQPPGLEAGRLLLPAQQAVLAFSHWCEVLCDVLEPAFAAAYNPGRDMTSEVYYPLAQQALTTGQIKEPPAGPWLAYIAARFVSDELLRAAYHKEGCWLKRTRKDGLLLLTPLPDYTYEAVEARYQKHLGDDANLRHKEYKRAVQHYEYARQIFKEIPDEDSALSMKAEIERIQAVQDLLQQEELPDHGEILLDSEAGLKELGAELARDLSLPGHHSTNQHSILFMLPDSELRCWLRERPEEDLQQANEKSSSIHRYVLTVPAGKHWSQYKDRSRYLQDLEQKTRTVFEALKETGRYHLALRNYNGVVEETFEPQA